MLKRRRNFLKSSIRRCILMACCCVGALGAHAQKYSVQGSVVADSAPMPYANVVLLSTDSAFVAGAVSNDSGNFLLEGISPASYILRVSMLGYQNHTQNIALASQNLKLGSISLGAQDVQLGEVRARGKKASYKIAGNSLITSVSNTSLETLGSATDVLNRVPGVLMEENEVKVFGRSAPLVYINNRKIINVAELETLPSDNIRSVELIRNPGVSYDADVDAVLIIHTKNNIFNGFAGQLMTEPRIGEHFGHKESLNLSYTKNAFNAFASYYHNHNKTPNRQENTQTLYDTVTWQQQVQAPFDQDYDYQQAKAGFDWQVAQKHAFGAQYTFVGTSTGLSTDDGLANVYQNGILLEQIASQRDGEDKPKQHLVNVFYRGNFNDVFSLHLDVDYASKNADKSQLNSEQSTLDGDREVDILSQSALDMWATKLVANYALTERSSLEFGGEWNQILGDGELLNPQDVVSSNEYTNKEEKLAFFAGYNGKINAWMLSAGLRYERADENMTEGEDETEVTDRTTHNLFPSLSFSGRFKNDLAMSLSFTSRTRRPSFANLNANTNYVNRFLMERGNPYLEATEVYNTELMLMYKLFTFSIAYNYENDPIAVAIDSEDGATVLGYQNYDKYQAITSFINFRPTIGLWEASYTLAFSQPFFDINQNSYNKPMANLRLNNMLNFPKGFTLALDYNLSSKGNNYEAEMNKVYHAMDVSLRKSFFDNKLQLRAELCDIFDWQRKDFTLLIDNLVLDQYVKNESRYFTFRIQYNFSNYKKKYRGKNASRDIYRM